MYSVVLMMAISGGGEAPAQFGRCGGGCNGCYASCHGGGRCGGCFGGGGCFGLRGRFGCSGGCFGGCFGCHGCNGRVVCHGCTGGACCGGGAGAVPSTEPKVMPKKTPGAAETPKSANNQTRATLIVHLPADATLKIDGTPTVATSERRVFSSPPLVPGSQYYYVLEAQVVRDGQPIRVREQVVVQPGQEREITLTMPAASGVTAR
ncbi:MAG: TIGR03000 domain-containing protein [Gemmataceae bacterium]|nr:TIGR03000 domain-containing protein [Gemmataceae bacterium]MCI0739206.1 TIGR03000 domain-containing protein [Gemmataceae bacterium]